MGHIEDVFFAELTAAAARNISALGLEAVAADLAAMPSGNLDDYTAFVQISGTIQGGVILTVGSELALALTAGYLLEPLSDEEAKSSAIEVIAELSNVICGNAIADDIPLPVYLGNPLLFVAKQAEIRTRSEKSRVQFFNTAKGPFRLMFIPMEHESELATILGAR